MLIIWLSFFLQYVCQRSGYAFVRDFVWNKMCSVWNAQSHSCVYGLNLQNEVSETQLERTYSCSGNLRTTEAPHEV
jgi:hypothetical protein